MKDYETVFVNLSQILPSQHRFAAGNVNDKVAKVLALKGQLRPQYDNGKSLYSPNEAIPAIAVNNSYVITDGHHSALASLQLHYQTLPINIIDQWEAPLDDEFWFWAEQKHYAYLKKMDGTISYHLPQLTHLEDDPLRYFASISSRKFYGTLSLEDSTGAEFPLWIKVKKDVPFIEWQLTDHLRAHGFSYHYGDENERLQFLIEHARAILINHPLPALKLVPEKQRYDDSMYIFEWLQSVN